MPPPRGLVQQFDHFLHRRPLLKPRAKLLIACSGGADSVALLRLMHAVNGSNYWRWKLVVGHVNHGLRGRASAADARFVRKLAKALGLGYAENNVNIARSAGGVVSEDAARQARYAALVKIVRQKKCAAIVVGHHADDQAETILMRLLRGCGLRGLGAMATRTGVHGIEVVRPLLWARGAELRGFLKDMGQPWREDATNATGKFLRNQVRLEVMPVLQRLRPGIVEALGRLSVNARLAERTLSRVSRAARKRASLKTRNGILLNRAKLQKMTLEVTRRVLREALIDRGVPADRIDFDQLLAAARRIKSRENGKVRFDFAGGQAVVVEKTVVQIQAATQIRVPNPSRDRQEATTWAAIRRWTRKIQAISSE